jgi:hypothetical protein
MKTSVRSKSSLQCKIKSLLVARDALHALEAADCFNSVTDDGDNVSLYKPPHPLGGIAHLTHAMEMSSAISAHQSKNLAQIHGRGGTCAAWHGGTDGDRFVAVFKPDEKCRLVCA